MRSNMHTVIILLLTLVYTIKSIFFLRQKNSDIKIKTITMKSQQSEYTCVENSCARIYTYVFTVVILLFTLVYAIKTIYSSKKKKQYFCLTNVFIFCSRYSSFPSGHRIYVWPRACNILTLSYKRA